MALQWQAWAHRCLEGGLSYAWFYAVLLIEEAYPCLLCQFVKRLQIIGVKSKLKEILIFLKFIEIAQDYK